MAFHFRRAKSLSALASALAVATLAVVPARGQVTSVSYLVIASFSAADGNHPAGPLLLAHDGAFYGTASGGASGAGAIYRLDAGNTFTTLYNFSGGTDGNAPGGALVQGQDHQLYGLTHSGGAFGAGVIFRLNTAGAFTVIHDFTFSEGYGYGSIIQAADGSFYGTKAYGGSCTDGAGCGTIFRLDSSGVMTTLHRFSGFSDGALPYELMQASDGNFYGTTWGQMATDGGGTIYRLDGSGTLTTLYGFPHGVNVKAGLTQGMDGYLYGTTVYGPDYGAGIVYKIDTSGTLTTLVASLAGSTRPRYVYAGLTQGTDGDLYGVSFYGGGSNLGTLYKVDTSGTLSVMHSFQGGSDGAFSFYRLTRGPNGTLYGVTNSGGTSNWGTIFVLRPSGYTATGTNISVAPIDPVTGTSPATLTFGDVDTAGTTTLAIGSATFQPPAGFRLGTPPTYYEIQTSAAFTGTVTVCINYSALSFSNENKLKLFHYENGTWVNRTVSLDTASNIVCAQVNSLSPFAVFEQIDTTPPDISPSITGTLGSNGWYRSDVSVRWSVADTDSEIASTSGCDAVSVVADTNGVSFTCSATSEGGTSSSTVSLRRDATVPTITLASPTPTTYLLNQAVSASYQCSDGASGLTSCAGTVADGANVPTSAVGQRSFALVATDGAGNTAGRDIQYSVGFNICALYDQEKSHNSGSTVAIKLMLCDVSGVNVSGPNTAVTALSVHQVSTDAPAALDDSGSSNPDLNFRYDPTLASGGGYVFNLSLKGYSRGTYAVSFRAGPDETVHTLLFGVR